jgi:hypothetical protein
MGSLADDIFTIITTSRRILRRTRNVSINYVEKIKIHVLYSSTFFRKPCHLSENVGKHGASREAVDDNMAERSMLDK